MQKKKLNEWVEEVKYWICEKKSLTMHKNKDKDKRQQEEEKNRKYLTRKDWWLSSEKWLWVYFI